jgi:hypothetical protein
MTKSQITDGNRLDHWALDIASSFVIERLERRAASWLMFFPSPMSCFRRPHRLAKCLPGSCVTTFLILRTMSRLATAWGIDRLARWLGRKYGSLQNLNTAWYRGFERWDQVEPPRFGTILSYSDFIDLCVEHLHCLFREILMLNNCLNNLFTNLQNRV